MAQASIERRVACELSSLEQGRHYAHVGGALLHALLDGADAVTHFQTDIPEESDQPLDLAAPLGVGWLRYQQHDVNVGAGVELTAPVAPNRNQRPGVDVGQMLGAPSFAKHYVNERGARVNEILNGIFGQKAGFQLFVSLPQIV